VSHDDPWLATEVGYLAAGCLFPVLLWLALSQKRRLFFFHVGPFHWSIRLGLAVFCGWYLMMNVRSDMEYPVALNEARASGDLEYDGVGGNTVIMIIGWIPPLLSCLVFMLGSFLYRWLRSDGCPRTS